MTPKSEKSRLSLVHLRITITESESRLLSEHIDVDGVSQVQHLIKHSNTFNTEM